MHSFDVPLFIQYPTGNTFLDVLPILSLFPCCTTLNIFRKTRRYTDLVLFTVGFLLALVYHYCQAHPQGLAVSRFLGISGDRWRTYDVLSCLILLTRTVGHIFGATHFPYSTLPNVLFPFLLIVLWLVPTPGAMSTLVVLTLMVMLTTGMAVVLVKAKPVAVIHRPVQGRRVFFCLYMGAFCFFLPNLLGQYWLFHSLWHLLLAAGYHLLYSELERSVLSTVRKNGKLA